MDRFNYEVLLLLHIAVMKDYICCETLDDTLKLSCFFGISVFRIRHECSIPFWTEVVNWFDDKKKDGQTFKNFMSRSGLVPGDAGNWTNVFLGMGAVVYKAPLKHATFCSNVSVVRQMARRTIF